jgi:hypothetical protein
MTQIKELKELTTSGAVVALGITVRSDAGTEIAVDAPRE